MEYDTNNIVVQLCTRGLEWEAKGSRAEAGRCFTEAWKAASNDWERFTAAHYVARYQDSLAAKLAWDEVALHCALNVDSVDIKSALPSLYLNIGKCHEDLEDFQKARKHYCLAASFVDYLPDSGYGQMIKNGIRQGLERVDSNPESTDGRVIAPVTTKR